MIQFCPKEAPPVPLSENRSQFFAWLTRIFLTSCDWAANGRVFI
jgi:hypothetical protein